MNMNERPKVSGRLHIVVKDKDGNITDERHVKNLIVNTGLAHIVQRMTGTAQASISHMGLGTSSALPSPSDTGLGSQLSPRKTVTALITPLGTEINYQSTFGAGDTIGAITEAGLFNANSAGVMMARTTFAAVNKQTDDTVSISWTISLSVGV